MEESLKEFINLLGQLIARRHWRACRSAPPAHPTMTEKPVAEKIKLARASNEPERTNGTS